MNIILALIMSLSGIVLPHDVPPVGCRGSVSVSVQNVVPQGGGTIRVMAVVGRGIPAQGRTVVIITSPCFESMLVDDTIVDYSESFEGATADGHLFDFIVPNDHCHGKYIVTVTVFPDGCRPMTGVCTFKF
jgi:hypothetical protein